jgi:hypothetical protein
MPTTGNAKYPYPNASASPDVPSDLLLLGQRLAKMNGAGIGYTANATTRAALVTDGDAFAGLQVYQADTGVVYQYTGSGWARVTRNMTPTSIGNTGGSASIGSNGAVTFSSATVVSLNGVFTSDFRDYRITISSSGTAATVLFNLRSSGSNNTSSVYDRTELLARNGGSTSSTTAGGTSWTIIGFANTLIKADIDLSAPAVAVETTAISRGGTHGNPATSSTSNGLVLNYLTHRTASAYDGFTITFSNSQSGVITVSGAD